jgi:hypothetical protein
MTLGTFDPSQAEQHGGGAAQAVEQDSVYFAPFAPPDARERLHDALAALWPASIDVQAATFATGGEILISGRGWETGATVEFFADGIAHRSEPLALGFSVSETTGGYVQGYFRNTYAAQVPEDQRTPVTLRAVGGGETATAPIPDFVFYV